jgi:acetyltransferase-like isoleucine patch superfamily enzyme
LLIELTEDTLGITQFNILLNIPVKIGVEFQPHPHWQHRVYNPNTLIPERIEQLTRDGQFAFSMAHSPVKAIVYQAFKKQLSLEYSQFPHLIHPSAVISGSVKTGFGAQIESNATVSACSSLGFGVNIKRNSGVPHHCILENFVTLNPGVMLESFVHA